MALRIGIDIGSTTVKVVVLDAQNKLLFRSYERHYSKTRERTCETLHLDQDHAIFPEDGDCFAAIGAALCTEDSQPRPFEELLDLLEHAATVSTPVDTMDPLFTSQADYEAFSARHRPWPSPRWTWPPTPGRLT